MRYCWPDSRPRASIGWRPADGAFYVWACVDHLTDDSQALCAEWLDSLSIATTPGIDFDPREGHRFVRFSFAGSTSDCVEAMRRLNEWVKRREKR